MWFFTDDKDLSEEEKKTREYNIYWRKARAKEAFIDDVKGFILCHCIFFPIIIFSILGLMWPLSLFLEWIDGYK